LAALAAVMTDGSPLQPAVGTAADTTLQMMMMMTMTRVHPAVTEKSVLPINYLYKVRRKCAGRMLLFRCHICFNVIIMSSLYSAAEPYF